MTDKYPRRTACPRERSSAEFYIEEMSRSELEVCIEQSIRKINELDVGRVSEGVKNVHTLLLGLIQHGGGGMIATAKSGRNHSVVDSSTLNTLNSEMLENTGTTSSRFGEFRELQDRVEYNISMQLLVLIVRIENGEFAVKADADELVVHILQILQGVLLIHPRSRTCFRGKHNIRLFLRILDPNSPVRPSFLMIIECVLMLVSLFIRNAQNLRNFEELGGVELICKLIKGEYSDGNGNSSSDDDKNNNKDGHQDKINLSGSVLTWHNVRIKSLEFLFFYLIPEFDETATAPPAETVVGAEGVLRRGMASKIGILKKHLNAEFVDGIVKEFVSDRPFGSAPTRW